MFHERCDIKIITFRAIGFLAPNKIILHLHIYLCNLLTFELWMLFQERFLCNRLYLYICIAEGRLELYWTVTISLPSCHWSTCCKQVCSCDLCNMFYDMNIDGLHSRRSIIPNSTVAWYTVNNTIKVEWLNIDSPSVAIFFHSRESNLKV